MADKIDYAKGKDVEGSHRKSADADHCPHCEGHEARLATVEKHLGIGRKAPTKDDIIRQRKRS